MIRLYTLVLSILFSSLLNAQETIEANITHEGNERSYRLYIPSGYNADTPTPLVFNLHGFGSNASEQEFYSGMNAVAEENDFFVCYPNGIDAQWNVENPFNHNWDDVDFISALIDELSDRFKINEAKVYSCGMSNGGFMSYRLACELNDRVAAIASVTGSMGSQLLDICEPDKAVPILQFHGLKDDVVLYGGTPGISLGLETVIDFWVDNNSCEMEPTSAMIDDINMNDMSRAEKIAYEFCDNNTQVILYLIDEGTHTWPGAVLNFPVTNYDINASEEIWTFFNQYELDITSSNSIVNTEALNIFPNPVRDVLNATDLDNTKYEILDRNGRKILDGTASHEINVTSLSAGIYLLKTDQNDKINVAKFTKI